MILMIEKHFENRINKGFVGTSYVAVCSRWSLS